MNKFNVIELGERFKKMQRIVSNSIYERVCARYQKVFIIVDAQNVRFRVRRNYHAESIISYINLILEEIDESLTKLLKINNADFFEESDSIKLYLQDFNMELKVAQNLIKKIRELFGRIYEKCAGYSNEILTEIDLLNIFQIYELMKEMQYEIERLLTYTEYLNIKDEEFYKIIVKIRYKDDEDTYGIREDYIEFFNHFNVIATGNSEILLYLNELISDNCFEREPGISYEEDEITPELDLIKRFFLDIYRIC